MKLYHNSRRNLLFLTLLYLTAALLVVTVCYANPQATGAAQPTGGSKTAGGEPAPTGGSKTGNGGGTNDGGQPAGGGTTGGTTGGGGAAKDPAAGGGNAGQGGGAKGNADPVNNPTNTPAAAAGKDGQQANPNNGATQTGGNKLPAITSTKAPQITGDANQALPTLPANPYAGVNGTMSWQQCVDYGKYCRDVICAYQNYTATCKGDGGCTCIGQIYSKGDPSVEAANYYFTIVAALVTILCLIFGHLY